jgi:small subunit ribosomal protein S21
VRRARKLARKKLQREGLLPMKPKPVFGAGPGGERGGAAGGRGGRWAARAALIPAFLKT